MAAILARRRVQAIQLLESHGLIDWGFGWDRAVRRAGLCNHHTKLITVSRHFGIDASDEEFTQILLHEIAHAIAGAHAGHGSKWRSIARRIGYTGGRTMNWEHKSVKAPWLGACPAGHTTERFRRPSRHVSCARCSPVFSPRHLITWRRVA